MNSARQLERIEKRLPAGCRLPSGFKTFLESALPLRIKWSSLANLGFGKAAEIEMVPFVHNADGGIVSLWFGTEPASVVSIDAHGEPPRIISIDFPNFLKAISASKTGVPDIDDSCDGILISRYRDKPTKSGTAALQRKLDSWVARHSALLEPNSSPDVENIRSELQRLTTQMIHDGLSKVYTPQHD